MNKLSTIVLMGVLLVSASPAKAYFHDYSRHGQTVRLHDKVKRLTHKLEKSSDEFARAKITIEIEEAKHELASLEATK